MISRAAQLGNRIDRDAMEPAPAHQPPRRMTVRQCLWPAILAVSALAATVVTLVDAPSLVRFPITLWFIGVCPGLAVIGLFGIRDVVTMWTLALATSLTLDILVASASLYVGLWSPLGILFVLTLVTFAAATGQVFGTAIIPGQLRHLVEWRIGASRTGSESTLRVPAPATDATRPPPSAAGRLRRYPTDLADHEWETIAPLLPPRQPFHKYDPRDLCNAIRYAERADVPWEALPNDFPPGRTVARFYRHLLRSGIWHQISQTLGDDTGLATSQELPMQRVAAPADAAAHKRGWPRGSSRRDRLRRFKR